MALDYSNTTIMGRLTQDPKLETIHGNSMVKINIANNYSYKSGNEKKEEVLFMECSAWGKQADLIAEYAKKGKRVLVSGRLRQSSWDAQDGTKRTKIALAIATIQFLDFAEKNENSQQPSPSNQNNHSNLDPFVEDADDIF
jgi:single-strand DNA-binding protein